MLVRATVDAVSYFLHPISRNELSLRKAVLPRHAESQWLDWRCFWLLASASAPSSSQRGLGRRSVWASFWCGACAHAPGYCSWSVQARRLNSAATCTLGVLGGINHRWCSARSVVLACPCWSLEGLLFRTQKFVWERASISLVTNACLRVHRTYTWGAAMGQPGYFVGRNFW